MNKTLLITIIATLAFVLSACGTSDVSLPEGSDNGIAFFSVTDAAADMGAVSSVEITFDSLSIQSAGSAWTDVALEEQTFDLLELESENALALLAQVELEPGTYNQFRLNVTSVTVTDDNGTHDVFVPSGVLRLAGRLVVNENETSSATFDFLVSESLHVTGNGQYIMTPVIQLETRERTQVSVEANNRIRVEGGQVRENVTLGMDLNGNMQQGRPVGVGANISIVDGKIQVQTPAGVRVGVDVGTGIGTIVSGQAGSGSGANAQGSASAQGSTNVQAGDGSAEVSASAEANASGDVLDGILG